MDHHLGPCPRSSSFPFEMGGLPIDPPEQRLPSDSPQQRPPIDTPQQRLPRMQSHSMPFLYPSILSSMGSTETHTSSQQYHRTPDPTASTSEPRCATLEGEKLKSALERLTAATNHQLKLTPLMPPAIVRQTGLLDIDVDADEAASAYRRTYDRSQDLLYDPSHERSRSMSPIGAFIRLTPGTSLHEHRCTTLVSALRQSATLLLFGLPANHSQPPRPH